MNIPENIILESERMVIKNPFSILPERLALLANDFDVALYLQKEFPFPYSQDDAIKFLDIVKKNWEEKKSFTFGIFLKNTNNFIGLISIHTKGEKRIEIGYWLGKEYWGKGYMTESVQLITDFAFKEFNVIKILAKVYSLNFASMSALLKNGFEIEATLKNEETLRNGVDVDVIRLVKFKI